MLNLSFFMPTKVIHSDQGVSKHQEEFSKLGKRALIVTGKHSAALSGALDDVMSVLKTAGIAFDHFDQVENNPSLANVEEGSRMARQFLPDFIIAIGGGSPLDAAKAIAALAVNPISAAQLYEGELGNPLPIIAIPTTAGTGSEVTPYSVLTIPEEQTKKGFGSPALFPKVAFLDQRYLRSVPQAVMLDTAVDAFSHLVEGYLSTTANSASDLLALEGMRIWGQSLTKLSHGQIDDNTRNNLLIASTLGGMTISHTGTTIVHALGYPLTYYHNIPHGQANGYLLGEYLKLASTVEPDKVKAVLNTVNLSTLDEFTELFRKLFPNRVSLSKEQLESYAAKTLKTKNVAKSLGNIDQQVLEEILKGSI